MQQFCMDWIVVCYDYDDVIVGVGGWRRMLLNSKRFRQYHTFSTRFASSSKLTDKIMQAAKYELLIELCT